MSCDGLTSKSSCTSPATCFKCYDGTGTEMGRRHFQRWVGCNLGTLKKSSKFLSINTFPPNLKLQVSIRTVISIPLLRRQPQSASHQGGRLVRKTLLALSTSLRPCTIKRDGQRAVPMIQLSRTQHTTSRQASTAFLVVKTTSSFLSHHHRTKHCTCYFFRKPSVSTHLCRRPW